MDPLVEMWLIILRSIAFSFILVYGLIGNMFVIYFFSMKMKKAPQFRWLIIHLAITDCVYAILTPIHFLYLLYNKNYWWLGTFLCKSTYIASIAVNVSAWILCLIGYERYRALCHPFSERLSRRTIHSMVALCWLLCSAIRADTIYRLDVRNDKCFPRYSGTTEYIINQILVLLSESILPIIFLSYFLLRVVITLRKRGFYLSSFENNRSIRSSTDSGLPSQTMRSNTSICFDTLFEDTDKQYDDVIYCKQREMANVFGEDEDMVDQLLKVGLISASRRCATRSSILTKIEDCDSNATMIQDSKRTSVLSNFGQPFKSAMKSARSSRRLSNLSDHDSNTNCHDSKRKSILINFGQPFKDTLSSARSSNRFSNTLSNSAHLNVTGYDTNHNNPATNRKSILSNLGRPFKDTIDSTRSSCRLSNVPTYFLSVAPVNRRSRVSFGSTNNSPIIPRHQIQSTDSYALNSRKSSLISTSSASSSTNISITSTNFKRPKPILVKNNSEESFTPAIKSLRSMSVGSTGSHRSNTTKPILTKKHSADSISNKKHIKEKDVLYGSDENLKKTVSKSSITTPKLLRRMPSRQSFQSIKESISRKTSLSTYSLLTKLRIKDKGDRTTIKVFSLTVLMFGFCTIPYNVFYFVVSCLYSYVFTKEEKKRYNERFLIANECLSFLVLSASIVNIFIYSGKFPEFRNEVNLWLNSIIKRNMKKEIKTGK